MSRNRTFNKKSDEGKSGGKVNYVKPKTKGRGKDKTDDKDTGKYFNDPSLYFTSTELANQAAQLSFQNVLGFGSIKGWQVPSILRLDTFGCPGVTYDFSGSLGDNIAPVSSFVSYPAVFEGKAGVNLMASKLYTSLSSFTGRTASYAPQDVAMMILAIAGIAENSEFIRRIFGLALTYNYRNRTLPLGLIRSMGIDTDDLAANISIYRMRFNVAISRINQIPLLDNIAFIRKARDIYQSVYMDDPTNMSQIFYYQPVGYHLLDEAGDDQGSILRYIPWVSGYNEGGATSKVVNVVTMADLISSLEAQITAVLESSTLNFIYADLLNMANKMSIKTWKFDYLPENYVVMPIYNQNALLQLHNLDIVGLPYGMDYQQDAEKMKFGSSAYPNQTVYVTPGNNVYCDVDKNNIVYNPMFNVVNDPAVSGVSIIDLPNDNPSIEEKIEALRIATADSGLVFPQSALGLTGTDKYCSGKALPDHWIGKAWLFSNISGGGNTPFNADDVIYNTLRLSDWGVELSGRLSQFEHAPIMKRANSQTYSFDAILGGLQFYTTVDYEYIKRLLNITYVGLFEFRV